MKKPIIGCILISLLFSLVGCSNKEVILDDDTTEEEPPNTKLKAIDCLPEQRNVDECIEIYQPVCATVHIQCITTPCDPVKETFENSCKACVNSLVISYTEGECSTNDEIKI